MYIQKNIILALKMNEILMHAIIQMDLEDMLSEISQTQKNKI